MVFFLHRLPPPRDACTLASRGYEIGVGGILVREDKNKDAIKIIVYKVRML